MSKDTFYFKHDNNASQDLRIVKLKIRHGMEGYGIFWHILELLHREGGVVDFDPDIIGYSFGCDREKVRSVIEDFGLFIVETGKFYSPRMCRDIAYRTDKIERASSGGKKSASTRKQNPASSGNAEPASSGKKIPLEVGKERKGEERKEEKEKNTPPIPPVAHTPRPERPDLPSYNPNGPRPPGWTDFDEQKLITGQEAKRAIKETLHVHNGGSVNGWKRIEAGCREWKALYQARDHYDRLEMPYSRCLDRVKAEYPDSDPIEKLKAITQAYVNDCQIHNRIKLSALNFIDGDRWKDDWSQTETESTANQGLCPDGSTWTRRPDGRYEVASKSGRKALMAEGWKP